MILQTLLLWGVPSLTILIAMCFSSHIICLCIEQTLAFCSQRSFLKDHAILFWLHAMIRRLFSPRGSCSLSANIC